MEKLLADFFKSENIEYYSCLDISDCRLLYPRKLPEYTVSVCFFLIPYYAEDGGKRNVSMYAVPRDYHLYIKELSERFEKLRKESEVMFDYRFFADNSPFCERSCAALARLGALGKNGLIINPEYGSFVFIGSICFSIPISITQRAKNFKGDLCGNCEKCKSFCPIERGKCSECLSNITQKKKITDEEAKIISQFPVKWGCDICQEVCPHNKEVKETPIDFFRHERIPFLTTETVSKMTDTEFSQRAYSWRGRDVIKRNLGL